MHYLILGILIHWMSITSCRTTACYLNIQHIITYNIACSFSMYLDIKILHCNLLKIDCARLFNSTIGDNCQMLTWVHKKIKFVCCKFCKFEIVVWCRQFCINYVLKFICFQENLPWRQQSWKQHLLPYKTVLQLSVHPYTCCDEPVFLLKSCIFNHWHKTFDDNKNDEIVVIDDHLPPIQGPYSKKTPDTTSDISRELFWISSWPLLHPFLSRSCFLSLIDTIGQLVKSSFSSTTPIHP